jgi:proteasome lid subunit RPN8/RPN11
MFKNRYAHKISAQRIAAQHKLLLERSRQLLSQLQHQVLDDLDFEGAQHVLTRLADVGEARRMLSELAPEAEANEDVPQFVIASEVVHAAYRKLNECQTESILYGIGSQYSNLYTIERLVPLKMETSGIAYACADAASSAKVLIDLEPYGSLLTGYFHTHPGRGPGANRPSSVDLANQAQLEQGNYHTIGGIFSRDGYVRFFTDQLKFTASISGKGVEHVQTNLWKLKSPENVQVC